MHKINMQLTLDERKKVCVWCSNQFKPTEWYSTSFDFFGALGVPYNVTFHFDHEQDAELFILRWS